MRATAQAGEAPSGAVGGTAAGDGPASTPGVESDAAAEYEAAVSLGVQEYGRGNWAEAIVAFQRAFDALPGPRPLRGMGIALFEQRRYADAIDALQRALAYEDHARPLNAEQRAHVVRTLEQARGYVASIVLQTRPPGARIEVNGRAVDSPTLILDGGRYEIVIRHEGYEPQRRELEVSLGDRRQLTIVLKPRERPGVADGATDSGVASWVGWSVAGIGGAALAGGLLLGALNASEYDSLFERCQDGGCDEGTRAEVESGRSRELVANVLIVGGAVLASAGVGLLLFAPDGGDAGARAGGNRGDGRLGERAGARIAPSCGARACGVVAWGHF